MKRCVFLLLLLGSASWLSAQQPSVRTRSMVHPDGSYTSSTIDYENLTMEEKTYGSDDRLRRHITYTLDEHHQPIGSIVYDLKGQPIYKATYHYDAMRTQVQEERRFTVEGQLIERLVFHYNPSGQVARTEAFNAQGQPIVPGATRRVATRRVLPATQQPVRPQTAPQQPVTTARAIPVTAGHADHGEATPEPVPVRQAVPVRKGPSVEVRSTR